MRGNRHKRQKAQFCASSFETLQVSGDIVNVFVGIDPEKIFVLAKWIPDFNFRSLSIAANGVFRGIGRQERDNEIIDADKLAFELLPGWQRDHNGSYWRLRWPGTASPRHKPRLLHDAGIVNGPSEARQVAEHIMTGSTLGLEISFAGFWVSNNNRIGPKPRQIISSDAKAVDESGNVGDLFGF